MSHSKPARIALFPNREVGIVWEDGREDYVAVRMLRLECPCAECVDEITGERRLDPRSVPEDVRIKHWEPVGQYAVRFVFSDGHDTGIYTFEKLSRIAGRDDS